MSASTLNTIESANQRYLNTLEERWNKSILEWAIPENILSEFKTSPFRLDPSTFSPDEPSATDRRLEIIKETLRDRGNNDSTVVANLTLIDVGAGAGSSLAPIRSPFKQVTCVEEASHMCQALQQNLANMYETASMYRIVQGRFPEVAKDIEPANVVNCSNVIYNVTDPAKFIRTLNDLATDLVILEATIRHPFYRTNDAFKHFWNLERPVTPTITDVFEITTALHYEPYLESLPSTYRRGVMSLEGVAQRLGLDETRLPELQRYIENNPMPENPSVLIWWRKQ